MTLTQAVLFMGAIPLLVGYLFGIAGKFIGGNVTYVLAVYILDVLMVSTDIVLTCRNRRLDRLAEAKEGSAAE